MKHGIEAANVSAFAIALLLGDRPAAARIQSIPEFNQGAES